MRRNVCSNKKGIELSINFIVMLILGILGLGIGLMFIPKMLNSSKEINAQVDQQSKEILQGMAMEGKVAIYPEEFEVKPGYGRAIGLGIMNVGQTGNFSIGAKFVSGKKNNGDTVISGEIIISDWTIIDLAARSDGDWIEISRSPVEVKRNERVIESLYFKAPKGTPSGSYSFAVLIMTGDDFDITKKYAGSKIVTLKVT
jgi:hypothetical protein